MLVKCEDAVLLVSGNLEKELRIVLLFTCGKEHCSIVLQNVHFFKCTSKKSHYRDVHRTHKVCKVSILPIIRKKIVYITACLQQL